MNKQTFQYKRYQGNTYLRLVMQNTSTKVLFQNKTEALHYVSIENSQYKFSILDMIHSIARYDPHTYEFILCYPELSACHHWTQTKSPLEYEEQNMKTDAEEIGLHSFDSRFTHFKGLMLSKDPPLLDGDEYLGDNDENPAGHYQYSVGCTRFHQNDKIAGPRFQEQTHLVSVYELLIRVPSIGFTCVQHIRFQFYFSTFLIFLF